MKGKKDGQIRFFSDGSVRTMKGKRVARYKNVGGKRYILTGAWGTKSRANKDAKGYRKQFGAARVFKLEPDNYGVYAGGRFGK